ncbi:MAG: GNAT family N-acetyltransferase [Pseudomonadota bacterium]
MAIRGVAPGDRADWADLWAQYNAFYGRVGETALSAAVVESTWARLHDPAEPVHGLVAAAGGRLLGIAHYVFHRNVIRIANTCYLQDLFTLETARGRGVGRALIEALGAECRRQGVRDIYWHTQTDNAAARALYDRLATDTGFLVYRQRF